MKQLAGLAAWPVVLMMGFGSAGAQYSENVIFHAQLDEHAQYSDIWGYTAPNGDEYALLGTSMGLSVINVTDKKNPYETGFIPGPTSAWRDIKSYQTYAYVTTEAGQGLDIIDLSDPENPVGLPNYTGFSSAHNLYIDTSTGRAYIAGSNLGAGGARILSLADPTSPTEIGSWENDYLHDVYVQDDVLYGAAIYVGTLYVLDVSNPASISTLGSMGNYPNAFTHNVWATADGNHVMTTDELVGGACRMWDVSNPQNITPTDLYLPNPNTIPHNAHIEGDLAIISHYTLGVRIVDISNPSAISEVGFYDTWPPDDSGNYRGCWGAFPFFGTSPDLIVASDFSNGLYVLEYKGPLGKVAGAVSNANAPSAMVSHARVEIVDTGNYADTDDAGGYSIEDVPGAKTMQASAYGYHTQNVATTITAGVTTVTNIALVPVAGGLVQGRVTDAGSSLPIEGADVVVVSTPLAQSTDALGDYEHSSVPTGVHTVRAHAPGYHAMESTISMTAGASFTIDFPLNAALVVEDFDGSVSGWTVSGSASSGQWELGDPQMTSSYLGTVQTGDDHTPGAGNTDCWVTGRLAGSGVGDNDVDGGSTILTSSAFDVTGLTSPRVSFWRWYVTGVLFNPTTDPWRVEISDDNGSSWTLLETTELPNPAWVNVDVAIEDFVAATSQIRLRFIAQDLGPDSIVEGAVDDFSIYGTDFTGATDAPGVAAPTDGVLSLGPSRPNPLHRGEAARLSFRLPTDSHVVARVYDVAGHRVTSLAEGPLPAGTHELSWDGRNRNGRPVAAGVYFVRLDAEAGSRSRKVLVMQ